MKAYRQWWLWTVEASAWCWQRLLRQVGRDLRVRESIPRGRGTEDQGSLSQARWIGPPEPERIDPLLPADVPSRWIAELQSRRDAGPPLGGMSALIRLSDQGVVMAMQVCESGWNQAGHLICLAPRVPATHAGRDRD